MNAPATGDPQWGGYMAITPAPEQGVFEVGLVMAGAVSAGAYTAGVFDFLIEALDAWEAAKRACAARNPDPTQWDIPGHKVRIRVVSGASAGAMTGAIAAVALNYNFPHVHDPTSGTTNPLYKSWVKDIDISKLLETRDLQTADAPVVSMLDSSSLLDILQSALDFKGAPAPARTYLAPTVRFIFTEGNLRGVPYFLEMRGNTVAGLGMVAHCDYQNFCVMYGQSTGSDLRADDIAVTFPNGFANPAWRALGMAALASGAFPIGLAPRIIERNGIDFDYRFVVVPGDNREPAQVARLLPHWSSQPPPPNPYGTAVVDGGTMDNEPLELARTDLAGLLGRNPRDGTLANRATILIDPFPDLASAVDDPTRGQGADLLNAGVALMGAWKDQARFDPVDLALAGDENTYSRFLIAPDRGVSPESNEFPLACGALGGFSGFLAEQYRQHDYMLGRRNCQQFLRQHFCLPTTNDPVFSAVNPRLKLQGSPWIAPGAGPPSLPIIPLIGNLAKDEPRPLWPKGAFAAGSLRAPASARLGAIIDRVLRTSVRLNWLFRFIAKIGLMKVRSTAIDRAIAVVQQQLEDRALL